LHADRHTEGGTLQTRRFADGACMITRNRHAHTPYGPDPNPEPNTDGQSLRRARALKRSEIVPNLRAGGGF